MSRITLSVLAALLLWPVPSAGINLGGRDVPRDKFIVFLFVGHSIMAGRVDDIDVETYQTHPRAWNYKFDDGTDAWIPAQPPVHQDVSWQRGGGPATPFLKKLVQDYPGYYFGVIQNAHSSVTCQADYRRGLAFYDEIVAIAGAVQSDATLGGVLCMLGAMESQNQAQALDFGNQIVGMLNEMRQDLAEPDLPLLINRLTRGNTYWQDVQNNIAQLPSLLTFTDIVASDGPYKPGDNVHYTWAGHQLWGRTAADQITSNGWFPGANVDNLPPIIASARPIDANTVVVAFDEDLLAASAETPGNYFLSGGVSVTVATLAADQKTVTLGTSALTSSTLYTLTVNGVEDLAGNVAAGEAAGFTYVHVDIPRTDLALWVRADAGLVKISGNFVPLWADQSGNGNDLIRARFANQPLWIDDQLNGEPVLRFGGPQDPEVDYMTRTLPAPTTMDSTLFFVSRIPAVGQNPNASMFASDDVGGSSASFQIEVDGGNPGNLQLFSANAYPIAPASTSFQVLTVRIAGTGLDFFIDGNPSGSYAIGASEAKAFNQFSLGNNRALSEFLAFDIAELLIYRAGLPAAERRQVEAYLGGKYGLMEAPPGITVTPTGGLITTEAGGSDTFTVVLDSVPSSGVTIPVSSSNPNEGTASPASLGFSAADWDQPQTVTVTGVDDAVQDGNVAYLVILGGSTSTDPDYAGMDPPDVSVSNLDDEGAVNLPPQAVINGPDTTSVGVSATYFGGNSTDDGTIVSYEWTFGDGGSDSGQMVNHLWASAGIFTVTLTVTDDGGLTGQDTLDVDVQPELQPSISVLNPVGGEVWQAGSTQHIRWTAVDLTDIRIDFSADGGQTWTLVDYSDTDDPTWGDYPWIVPGIESSQCAVMVQGYYSEAPAQSGWFTITRGPVPDGGAPDAGLDGDADWPGDRDKITGGCGCGGGGGVSWFGMIWLVGWSFRKRKRGVRCWFTPPTPR